MPYSQINHAFHLIGQIGLQKALHSKQDNCASEGHLGHIEGSVQTEVLRTGYFKRPSRMRF